MATSYLEPGSVVLVTGASGGIGFEIASQAAAGGAAVVVHGSRAETVDGAIERLLSLHPSGRFIPAASDFRPDGAIEAMVAEAVERAGRLDAVVHCAVTAPAGASGLFAEADPSTFGLAAAQLLGSFQRLCFATRPHLAQRGGAIVGFVSDAGRFAAPHQSIVGAAFGGIVAFARNLSTEISRDGIRINIISPSYVVGTPVYELRTMRGRTESAVARAGLGLPGPQDIAPTALFLCSSASSKTTGQVISINGGLSA